MPEMLKPASSAEKSIVTQTKQELNTLYMESERKIHHLRKLRFMKLRTTAPKPFQRVVGGGIRSPLSYRLVQTVVGMICKERPSFKRIPLNRGNREAAERLQMSADPMLQDLERIARRPLMYQMVDAMVADGRSVVKCYRDVWQGFPQMEEGDDNIGEYNRRVAEFVTTGATHPLRMRQVDALNFKVPLTDYDPPYVMEIGKKPLLGVMKAYGLKFGESGNNKLVPMEDGTSFHYLELPSGMANTVDVAEIWLDDEMYVDIGGDVYKCNNDLGFKPYVWASGETSSHPDPALNSLSILYPFAGIEPWLNTMLTVLASWGVIGGTPILYTSRKMPPGGGVPDVTPQLSEIPLGKRIDLGVGGEIGFVQPPPVGREVLEFIQFLVDFLDRAGLPQLAYGSIGTRTPGTAFQGALEQAIAKVNPITTAAQDMIAEVVKMQWRIIENLDQPLYVTGVGVQPGMVGSRRKQLGRYVINPRDIGGYYDLHARIKVGNTQDVIARGMHAAFMHDKKLWSRERSMEYADVDNPWDEFKAITANTLEESPLFTQMMLSEAIKSEPEMMQRAQELQGQGVDVMGMLGMAPGAGGAPPPPMQGGAPGGIPGMPPGMAPAPKRGGKVSGSPKNPGGNRGRRGSGSRGHS